MQLTLTDAEARTLQGMLNDMLPEIQRERARTDLPARELRHELVERENLCERLIGQLQGGPAGTATRNA